MKAIRIFLNVDMDFETAEAGLNAVNRELDDDPHNNLLWYEKAKHYYFYHTLNPFRSLDDANAPGVCELLIPMLRRALLYGNRSVQVFHDEMAASYEAHDFHAVIARIDEIIANGSDHFTSLALSNAMDYDLCCDMVYWGVVAGVKASRMEGLDTLLAVAKALGMDFTGEGNRIWLRREHDVLKKYFFSDNCIQMEVLWRYVAEKKSADAIVVRYWDDLLALLCVLRELYSLGLYDALMEYVWWYIAQEGESFVTSIFTIWDMEGRCLPKMAIQVSSDESIASAAALVQEDLFWMLSAFCASEESPESLRDAFDNSFEELLTPEGIERVGNITAPTSIHELFPHGQAPAVYEEFYAYTKRLRLAYHYAKDAHNPSAAMILNLLASMYRKLEYKELMFSLYTQCAALTLENETYQNKWGGVCLMSYLSMLHGYRMAYGQERRCIEYILKLPTFGVMFRHRKLYHDFATSYLQCLVKMQMYDTAKRVADDMLANWPMDETIQKIAKTYADSTGLDNGEYNFFYAPTVGRSAESYYCIPGNGVRGDVTLTYTSEHSLYDNLQRRWITLYKDRDQIDDRFSGERYMAYCARFNNHLVRSAIRCGLYDQAVTHIHELEATDLRLRIPYLNVLKMSKHMPNAMVQWLCEVFALISADTGQNTPKCVLYSRNDISRIISALAKTWQTNIREEEKTPVAQGSHLSAHVMVVFWYDGAECMAFVCSADTGLVEKVFRFDEVNEEKINDWCDNYYGLKLYSPLRYQADGSVVCDDARYKAFHFMMDEMNHSFSELYTYLQNREETSSISLAPFQAMYGLPLNWLGPENGTMKGEPLCVKYNVTFSIGCGVYPAGGQARRGQESPSIGIIANSLAGCSPGGVDQSLPFASLEKREIMALAKEAGFSTVGVEASEATIQAASNIMQNNAIVHIACHGAFNETHVENSGIALAGIEDGDMSILSLRQIWDEMNLSGCTFMNLSSCHTGAIDLKRQESCEFFGLVQGMLAAGVRTVLACTADLDDALSLILNSYLYRNILDKGMPPKEAFHCVIQTLDDISLEDLAVFHKDIENKDAVRRLSNLIQSISKAKGSDRWSLVDPAWWSTIRIFELETALNEGQMLFSRGML